MLPFVDMVSKDGFVIEGRGVSPHFEMEFTTDDREQLTDEEVRGVIFKSNDFYMDHHA
jgi:hypothetical protein